MCTSTVTHTKPKPHKPYVKLEMGKMYMFKYDGEVEPDEKAIILLIGTKAITVVAVGDRSGCSDEVGNSWLHCFQSIKQFELDHQDNLFEFHGSVTLSQP